MKKGCMRKASREEWEDYHTIRVVMNPWSPFCKERFTLKQIREKVDGHLHKTKANPWGGWQVIDFSDRWQRFCKRVGIRMRKKRNRPTYWYYI